MSVFAHFSPTRTFIKPPGGLVRRDDAQARGFNAFTPHLRLKRIKKRCADANVTHRFCDPEIRDEAPVAAANPNDPVVDERQKAPCPPYGIADGRISVPFNQISVNLVYDVPYETFYRVDIVNAGAAYREKGRRHSGSRSAYSPAIWSNAS